MIRSRLFNTQHYLLLATLLLAAATTSLFAEDSIPLPEIVVLNPVQNLYTEVLFDHEMHQDGYECSLCHHLSEQQDLDSATNCELCHNRDTKNPILVSTPRSCGECHHKDNTSYNDQGKKDRLPKTLWRFHLDTPSLRAAYHLQCLDCHRQDGGPVGCTECHSLSQKGRQLFYVKD